MEEDDKVTDVENRIEIIGRLEQALLAELQLLPVAIRDEVCARIVAHAVMLWESSPVQPMKINRNGHHDHYYCDACGKILEDQKIVRRQSK